MLHKFPTYNKDETDKVHLLNMNMVQIIQIKLLTRSP